MSYPRLNRQYHGDCCHIIYGRAVAPSGFAREYTHSEKDISGFPKINEKVFFKNINKSPYKKDTKHNSYYPSQKDGWEDVHEIKGESEPVDRTHLVTNPSISGSQKTDFEAGTNP